MSDEIGPLNPEAMGDLGKHLRKGLFEECQTLVKDIEGKVFELLKKNKKKIEGIGKSLLKNETIDYFRLTQLVPKKQENSINFMELLKS